MPAIVRFLFISAMLIVIGLEISHAQQQPDPAFLQQIIREMQAQRNRAMDDAAATAANAAKIADDLAKANARIKELEAKLPKEAEPAK